MKLHPVIAGAVAALDIALALLLALTLAAHDCGRITNGGIALAVFFIVSIMSYGAIYIVPGIIAGFVAARMERARSAGFWLTLTAALALVLAVAIATQAPVAPQPFPAHCEVGM